MNRATIWLLIVAVIFLGSFAYAAGGDMIISSDASLGYMTITGNVYVTYGSTLTITGPLTINGDLYVWGTVNNYGALEVGNSLNCLHYNYMLSAGNYDYGYFNNYATITVGSLNVTDSWIHTSIPGASNTATIPPTPTATPRPGATTAPTDAPITNVSWSIKDGVLTIKGNGSMPDYNFSNVPWASAARTATKIVVEEGITRIGQCAFYDFGNVTDIVLPSTLGSIGIWAFYGCSNLSSITIPQGVTAVESWAFSDCYNLKTVTMPDTINNMGLNVFDGANNVAVRVPSSGKYVINYCKSYGIEYSTICDTHVEVIDYGYSSTCTETGLSDGKHCSVCNEVLVPQTVLPTADHAEIVMPSIPATYYSEGMSDRIECANCGKVIGDYEVIPVVDVEIIRLPAGVLYIREQAFLNDKLQCVVIPEGCLEIDREAFANNRDLKFADMPSTLKFIDPTAFDGCSSDLIIIADDGSLAQSYAEMHGITCVIRN